MYKLPIITTSRNFLLRRGLAYMYVTSANPDADWTLSDISINDTRSLPARVLAPLYNKDPSLHILYNDEPPTASTALTFGHTKGAVFADHSGGVWLIHSAPNFPIEPFTKKTNKYNKYFYPSSAARYGQSFMCISLAGDQLNTLGSQLMFNKPKVYSSNLPDDLSAIYPNLTLVANNQYVRKAPWSQKATLRSRRGVEFTSYAKTARFGKDLYSSLVAPDIGSELQVRTI